MTAPAIAAPTNSTKQSATMAIARIEKRDTALSLEQTFALAEQLVPTGMLPETIKKPGQAVAIMLAGQELGMPPMRALRSLNMVKGKVTENADSQLARFKSDGGRAHFEKLDETTAVLFLRHPNGDEHKETFTIEDARKAGLASSAMYQKYPKAMLRSRCITAALKSIGWEGGAGTYDPSELDVPLHATASVTQSEAVTSDVDEGIVDASDVEIEAAEPEPIVLTLDEALTHPFPWRAPEKYAGKPLASLSDKMLGIVRDAIVKECDEKGATPARERLRRAVTMVIEHRAAASPPAAETEPTVEQLQAAGVQASEQVERDELTAKLLELLDSPAIATDVSIALQADLRRGMSIEELRRNVDVVGRQVAAAPAGELPLGGAKTKAKKNAVAEGR